MSELAKNSKKNLNKSVQSEITTLLIVAVAFVIVEIFKSVGLINSHVQGMLVPLCYYSIVAVSLNLVVGILGDLSLGHAGFMCVGAYASSIFSVVTKDAIPSTWLRFTLAIILGGIFAAIFGFLIGIPVLRLSGDYLAIVTLAFGEIIKNILGSIYVGYDSNGIHMSFESTSSLNLEEDGKLLINGPLGISGTPKNATFEVGVALLLITLVVVLNFINSRGGRAVMSVRDNRIAAESVGINVTKYKLIAFTLSAFFAGIAGVLYSHNIAVLAASSKNFGYNMSILFLVFVVLGGIGNIRGSVIAAVVLTLLPELLRSMNDYRMLIYSIVLILMMIFTSSPKMIEYREKHGLHRKVKAGNKKNNVPKDAGGEENV